MTRCALYSHYDSFGHLLYIGMSANPTRRLTEHNSRSGWAERIANVKVEWFDSRGAAMDAEAAAIAAHNPPGNVTVRPCTSRGKTALATYLRENGIHQAEFAERLGVSQANISKLCSGKVLPSLRMAVQIEDMTGGAITPRSFLRDDADRKGAA